MALPKKYRGTNNERASDLIGGVAEGYQEGAAIGGPLVGLGNAAFKGVENWVSKGAERKGIRDLQKKNMRDMEKARMTTGEVEQMVATGQGAAGAQAFARRLGKGRPRTGAEFDRERRETEIATSAGAEKVGGAISALGQQYAKQRQGLSDKGTELYEQLKSVKTNPMAGITGIVGDIASSPESIRAFRKAVDPNNKLWKEASGYGQGFIPAGNMRYGFIPGQGMGYMPYTNEEDEEVDEVQQTKFEI